MQLNKKIMPFFFGSKEVILIAVLLIIGFEAFFIKSSSIIACQELPTSCEEGRVIIDSSLFEIKDKPNKKVIFLLRKNKKEKDNVIKARSLIIENFCENRGMKEKCIIGVSNPTDNLGRSELYVNGELFNTINYAKNMSSFCVMD